MIFRQLFDPRSSTYTYLLADGGEAVIVDPVFEHARRDAALVRELGLRLQWTVETHVHADHVTGGWLLKRELGSGTVLGHGGGADCADRLVHQGDRIAFGERWIEVRETPGHTDGCVTYVLDDQSMAFTGDALLVRGAGRTDFQQGDAARLYRSIHEQILSLPEDTALWPAHDYSGRTSTTVGEEKRFNPRVGGAQSVEDFVGYMTNLGLPHPRQIDEAVPANLRCGRPLEPVGDAPGFAPLRWTFAGIWEIEPEDLREALSRVTVLDVRDPAELDGPLGHLPGVVNVPLTELAAGADVPEGPLVTVCRSGARSAQAVVLLGRRERRDVANLAGGMLRWRALGLPVEGGAE
ncbi:MAG: MBL fold metallo-hydrolase [Alphaproteobacteria bacterium]|nr:MBL fold metallo-hydrolase [Alphaproteobacteria bacterium]